MEFICYGRAEVIVDKYYENTPREGAYVSREMNVLKLFPNKALYVGLDNSFKEKNQP